jgi:hypothetical protein
VGNRYANGNGLAPFKEKQNNPQRYKALKYFS